MMMFMAKVVLVCAGFVTCGTLLSLPSSLLTGAGKGAGRVIVVSGEKIVSGFDWIEKEKQNEKQAAAEANASAMKPVMAPLVIAIDRNTAVAESVAFNQALQLNQGRALSDDIRGRLDGINSTASEACEAIKAMSFPVVYVAGKRVFVVPVDDFKVGMGDRIESRVVEGRSYFLVDSSNAK